MPLEFARHPVRPRDSSELFFFSANGVWSLPVFYEPSFGFGTPESLLSGNYRWGYALANGAGGRVWDYEPGSSRSGTRPKTQSPPPIRIVLDWFDELRERVSGP